MFIPQAKLNSPLRALNSTVTGSFNGSLRSMPYSLITTSLLSHASSLTSQFRVVEPILRGDFLVRRRAGSDGRRSLYCHPLIAPRFAFAQPEKDHRRNAQHMNQ